LWDYGVIAVISPENERRGNYEEMQRIDNSPKNAGPQKERCAAMRNGTNNNRPSDELLSAFLELQQIFS
jgi:hypothetical protein